MAVATREVKIANPARGHGHMTAKQIKYFGTARQKAALKAKRNAARSQPKKNSARRHNKAAPAKKNPVGHLLNLTLGNPAKGGKNVAHSHKKKKSKTKYKRNPPKPRPAGKSNPAKHYHKHRKNPSMTSISALVEQGVGVIAGAVGSKLVTQAVLGASNTGPMGYLGNAVATGLLAAAAHMIAKKKSLTAGITVGGVVQILIRVISDYSLLGKYTSQLNLGVGDYMLWNGTQPARAVDGLHSAMLEVPQGWGPGAPMAVVAAPGVAGYPAGMVDRGDLGGFC